MKPVEFVTALRSDEKIYDRMQSRPDPSTSAQQQIQPAATTRPATSLLCTIPIRFVKLVDLCSSAFLSTTILTEETN